MGVQRLGAASMPGRWRGRASMPGSWGLAAIGKKKRAAVLPPREDWYFFPGKNSDLGAGLAGCRLRCRAGGAAGGFYAGQAARQELNTSGTCVEVPWNWQPLSLEGVSQMVYILPERLPALVRPAFDLVLRRIRSLKRCVQA